MSGVRSLSRNYCFSVRLASSTSRLATKCRWPRLFAARARMRPCVGPCVADRSAGRLGTISNAVRSACRATLEASDACLAVPRGTLNVFLSRRGERFASSMRIARRRARTDENVRRTACKDKLFLFSILLSLNFVTPVSTALPRVGVERPNGSYVARTLKRVGRAISSRSQTNVAGDRHALTEHQLHGHEWRKEDSVFSSRFTCKP